MGEQGEHAGARAEHRAALKCRSTYAEAHNNLRVELVHEGRYTLVYARRYDEAIAQYREAGAQDLLWALLIKNEFLFSH